MHTITKINYNIKMGSTIVGPRNQTRI